VRVSLFFSFFFFFIIVIIITIIIAKTYQLETSSARALDLKPNSLTLPA